MRQSPPRLVAAWLALDTLPTELVPGWAAEWLADGIDGKALETLAGLHGDDPREVRDVLPDALAEAGAPVPAVDCASVEVAYDFIARRCLDGSASEYWVAQKVAELFVNSNYRKEFLEAPLGAVHGIDDERSGGWGRTPEDLAAAVRVACEKQISPV
jgi:hypothetical protein